MLGKLSLSTWLMAIGLLLAAIGFAATYWLNASGQAASPSPSMALIMVGAVSLLALGVFTFVVGLALYVILPALDRHKAREGYGSYRTVLACLGLAIVVSLILQFLFIFGVALAEPASAIGSFGLGVGRGAQQMLGPMGIVVSVVTLEFSLLGVLWVRIVRPGIITWTRMGLTGENLGRRILYGLATGVAIFVAAAIVELVMSQFGIEQTQMKLFSSIKKASLAEFALVVLAGGPLAALVEEAFFRGYVFHAFWEQKGTWQAYLFSSLIFGAAHLNWEAFPPIFVLGLLLAFVYRRTHSVIPPMIGHGINNTISFAALYFSAV
ncbi:MAG: CPBP family intramembrane metalloprotease [Chloroflexi bacterium]|nr:CPBP family intramembrane metalloprotease [Chloroflexota bacterium]